MDTEASNNFAAESNILGGLFGDDSFTASSLILELGTFNPKNLMKGGFKMLGEFLSSSGIVKNISDLFELDCP